MYDDAFDAPILKGPARLSRAHGLLFLGLLISFSLLTYFIVGSGSPSELRERPVELAVLGTITGPFVGAIARNGQSCCLNASIELAWYSGPFLAACLFAQVIPLPFHRGQRIVRLTLWTLGWLAWFLSGIVSYGHALS